MNQWEITHLCCQFNALLGFRDRKCCIVICIVIANTNSKYRGVFRTIPNICDRTFLRKYLKARSLTVFTKKFHHIFLRGF